MYTRVDVPEAYRVDAKPFIERPFFLEEVVWSTSAEKFSLLPNSKRQMPGDVLRSNPSLLSAMKIGSMYRSDLSLSISVAGTITHAGCILVGILPPMPKPFKTGPHDSLVNTILSGPHGFLYANEATSINIDVPWYCNSDMATLDMELKSANYIPSLDITVNNGNYGTLVFLVLNKLSPSTGSSTQLSIIVESCFKNLDIVVPTPRYVEWTEQSFEGVAEGAKSMISGLFNQTATGLKSVASDAIDAARQYIFGWTGLHNPNYTTIDRRIITTPRNFPNQIDTEQYFEKLDPNGKYDRIVQSPIFGSAVDEMRIQHIVSKKQFVGSFTVSSSDTVGKLVWVRPISPYQGGNSAERANVYNNIELIHRLTRAWRGSLNIHIASVMNNKQQVKLKVLKMYNPSLKAKTSYPTYASIANAPSHLIEYTQGGQEVKVDLPFLCRNDLIPCSRDLTFEALYHGLYYIYVAQPLANSDGSPTTIEFNVFISGGEDLTFYGYSTEMSIWNGFDSFDVPQQLKNFSRAIGTRLIVRDAGEIETKEGDTLNSIAIKQRTTVRAIFDRNPWLDRIFKSGKAGDSLPVGTRLVIPKYKEGKNMPTIVSRKWEGKNHLSVNSVDDDNEDQDEPTLAEEQMEDVFEEESLIAEVYRDIKIKKIVAKWMRKSAMGTLSYVSKQCVCPMEQQSLEVMNEPQTQDDPNRKDTVKDFNHLDRLMPLVDIRPLVRRMYKIYGATQEVGVGIAKTFQLPLADIIGEDNLYRLSSPLSIISNMYYGKTAGFKISFRVSSLDRTTATIPNYTVSCRYLPPNMSYDDTNNTVMGCLANVDEDTANPFTVPAGGMFPLPYQITPVLSNENPGSQLYEFSIPDVTLYKYMGSPNKFLPGDVSSSYLSTMDFGNVMLSIMNLSNEKATYGMEIFCGISDESRFGLHCIAPKLDIPVFEKEGKTYIKTLYIGNGTGSTTAPSPVLNTFLYKGGLL